MVAKLAAEDMRIIPVVDLADEVFDPDTQELERTITVTATQVDRQLKSRDMTAEEQAEYDDDKASREEDQLLIAIVAKQGNLTQADMKQVLRQLVRRSIGT